MALELGRIPESGEYDRLAVGERLGSAKRALRAYVQGSGVEGLDWDACGCALESDSRQTALGNPV